MDTRSLSGGAPRVLVIMPARNEATRIGTVLHEISECLPGADVLVIDDDSTDETVGVARRAGAVVAKLPLHLGYGGALQTGYRYAVRQGYTTLVQMDSDGQHRPQDIDALLAPVLGGECDLCIGSRFCVLATSEEGQDAYEMGALRSLGRRTFSALARIGGLQVTDPTSGMQAMNRSALELFTSSWYPVDYPDVDVLLLAHRRGLKIREVSVRMKPSPRPSLLHSGWMPVYYVYRMMLSLWALGAIPKKGPIPLANSHSGTGIEERDESAG